jgi:hypothetical protein
MPSLVPAGGPTPLLMLTSLSLSGKSSLTNTSKHMSREPVRGAHCAIRRSAVRSQGERTALLWDAHCAPNRAQCARAVRAVESVRPVGLVGGTFLHTLRTYEALALGALALARRLHRACLTLPPSDPHGTPLVPLHGTPTCCRCAPRATAASSARSASGARGHTSRRTSHCRSSAARATAAARTVCFAV